MQKLTPGFKNHMKNLNNIRFHKTRYFFISYDNQVLLGVLPKWPFLHPPKKGLPLLFNLAKKRIYTWTLSWKESLLICFENCQGIPYSNK